MASSEARPVAVPVTGSREPATKSAGCGTVAPWDYYKPLRTTPGEQAFRPLAEGGCALGRA